MRCCPRIADQSAAPMGCRTDSPPANILQSSPGQWEAGHIFGCTRGPSLHTQRINPAPLPIPAESAPPEPNPLLSLCNISAASHCPVPLIISYFWRLWGCFVNSPKMFLRQTGFVRRKNPSPLGIFSTFKQRLTGREEFLRGAALYHRAWAAAPQNASVLRGPLPF